MGFTEDDLRKMGVVLLPDGTYGKPRKEHPSNAVKQPIYATPITPARTVTLPLIQGTIPFASTDKVLIDSIVIRKITLTLFGIPMPKQSVRGHANGSYKMSKTDKKIYNVLYYQPKEFAERVKDYQTQIRKQLPAEFKIFENEVHVTKWHFVYPPLKAFQKIKGRMDDLRNGKIFYKNTRADLIDNIKKLVADSMTGLVYKDDGLIVTENNTAKYYGTGGMIIIEMEGY